MVDYFIPDGVSGQYFVCRSYGTLSVAACARNYADAPRQLDRGRLGACIGCAVGAGHAGEKACAAAPAVADAIHLPSHHFCVRCRRAATDEDQKLIGRMRLLRNKTMCVSCYNRDREVKSGRNAKGNVPRKWANLMRARISIVSGGASEIVELHDPVYDSLEAVYTSLRASHKKDIAVGWAAARPVLMAEAVPS